MNVHGFKRIPSLETDGAAKDRSISPGATLRTRKSIEQYVRAVSGHVSAKVPKDQIESVRSPLGQPIGIA